MEGDSLVVQAQALSSSQAHAPATGARSLSLAQEGLDVVSVVDLGMMDGGRCEPRYGVSDPIAEITGKCYITLIWASGFFSLLPRRGSTWNGNTQMEGLQHG